MRNGYGFSAMPLGEHLAGIMSGKEYREYLLRSNQNRGDWDWDILANSFDINELIGAGFDEELSFMFDDVMSLSEDGFNFEKAVAEVTVPVTKPGEIIKLGNHFLMCGDSTKAEDVAKLMGGSKTSFVFSERSARCSSRRASANPRRSGSARHQKADHASYLSEDLRDTSPPTEGGYHGREGFGEAQERTDDPSELCGGGYRMPFESDKESKLEHIHSREEILSILLSFCEKFEPERELADAEGVYLMEVVSEDKTKRFVYQRKGTFGGKIESAGTTIRSEDLDDGYSRTLADYDPNTGEWTDQ